MSGAREYPPTVARRVVLPRKTQTESRPIVAITRELIVVEALNDDVFSASELSDILPNIPPSILVVQGFGQHLDRLRDIYGNEDSPRYDPLFNYRVTPIKRYARPWNDGRKIEQGMIVDAVCNYVGWKGADKKKANRYHYPLDPIWFLTTGIDELDDSDRPRIVKLYEWAKNVRSWCMENGLKVKASAGGIAAQLLRDARFWPEPRRKAPRLINDIARYQLPGNYYRLRAKTGHYYRAIYLDMENAHHAVAARIQFPDVNTLHAYGNWGEDSRETETDYVPREAVPFANGKSDILKRYGLFRVRLSVPTIHPNHFPPPYMERAGVRDIFVYSNELELIRQLGGEILGVHAAYVSSDVDTGLSKYAKFAIGEIRKHPDYKPWLKPTLHASYGLLAARPVAFETGYLHAKGGEATEYHMGNASIPVLARKRPREIETAIANVIHRGMIEAEVRREALWFSRYLTEVEGHKVLGIYADAIFIEDTGRPLGLLQPPWRLSRYVTSLRFHSATHFTSPQLSRLPGVPRTARERFLRDRELAGHLATVRAESGPPAARGVSFPADPRRKPSSRRMR